MNIWGKYLGCCICTFEDQSFQRLGKYIKKKTCRIYIRMCGAISISCHCFKTNQHCTSRLDFGPPLHIHYIMVTPLIPTFTHVVIRMFKIVILNCRQGSCYATQCDRQLVSRRISACNQPVNEHSLLPTDQFMNGHWEDWMEKRIHVFTPSHSKQRYGLKHPSCLMSRVSASIDTLHVWHNQMWIF